MARTGSIRIEQQEPNAPLQLVVSKNDAEAKINTQIKEGEDLLKLPTGDLHAISQLKSKRIQWFDYTKELLKRLFNTGEISDEFSKQYGYVVPSSSEAEIRFAHRDIQMHLDRLHSIFKRLDLFSVQSVASVNIKEPVLNDKVFIVHGHNDAVKEGVARLLEKLSLNAVILHEQSNEGKTIIEKFEKHSDVGFAVVLLTADDYGGSNIDKGTVKLRARQNVILELGYFLGKLNRQKVCVIYEEGVELPSDMSGIIYVKYDLAGTWKYQLTRELKAAGYKVDMNNI